MTTIEPSAAMLYSQVREQSRAVIESELQRLARRARRLSDDDLATIEATLDDLADHLILGRLQELPHRVELLEELLRPP